MMSALRRFLISSVAFTLMMIVTGCGNREESNREESNRDTEEIDLGVFILSCDPVCFVDLGVSYSSLFDEPPAFEMMHDNELRGEIMGLSGSTDGRVSVNQIPPYPLAGVGPVSSDMSFDDFEEKALFILFSDGTFRDSSFIKVLEESCARSLLALLSTKCRIEYGDHDRSIVDITKL